MNGPGLARMAWRNLWRNRRRTLVTLSSISFGVLLAGLLTGMGDWQWRQVIDLAARMGGGHVSLQHNELLERPSLSRTVLWDDSLRELLVHVPEAERAVMRISGPVMLATASDSQAAAFLAFDPEREDSSTLPALEDITAGEGFSSSRDRGIILGARLAELLGCRLGSKVVYTMTDRHGEIVSALARVRGIVTTGAPGVDARLCLLAADSAREVLGYETDEGTQIGVFLNDYRSSDAVAVRLAAALQAPTAALTWSQLQPDLASIVSLKLGGMLFMELLILSLITAGIFNTLFMSVMERLREFGILMAIGFSPGQLYRLVLWESLWLALVGLVAGVVILAPPYLYIASHGIDLTAAMGDEGLEIASGVMQPILRVDIYPEHAAAIAAAILAATLLAGLYPAWRAGRVVPVETITLV